MDSNSMMNFHFHHHRRRKVDLELEGEGSCMWMKVAEVTAVVEMELGYMDYHKKHTLCTGSVPWRWF